MNVSLRGSFKVQRAAEPTPSHKFVGWRLRYPAEGGNYNPPGMPAVAPSFWQDGFDFRERMQWCSYDLMCSANPVITPSRWRNVFKHDIAFTNYQGFDNPGDPRADYVNLRDLIFPYPKLMKGTICAGSFYRGEVVGDTLRMKPGVHAIDARGAMPSVAEIMERCWYFYATNNTTNPSHFAQGWDGADYYGPVLIPYLLDREVTYPLAWFQRWEADELPDPLKIYR